jgi:hypothetical protein
MRWRSCSPGVDLVTNVRRSIPVPGRRTSPVTTHQPTELGATGTSRRSTQVRLCVIDMAHSSADEVAVTRPRTPTPADVGARLWAPIETSSASLFGSTAYPNTHDSHSAPNEHRPNSSGNEPVTKLDDLFLQGRVVVVSAHLDDAALSLGATIARVASMGGEVSVLTVLAGDPDSNSAATPRGLRRM